jgi:DNA primase
MRRASTGRAGRRRATRPGRRLGAVAGLIRDDDIALVRERARIDEVVSAYVTLRHAGGGSQKGLCPFHDEKSPSFNVNPSKNVYHCFGCGEGGDVISFLMRIDGLAFSEAVERLADKYGVQLRYQEGTDRPVRRDHNLRPRMLEAHKVAQAYYADRLDTPDAAPARRFLDDRGFDREAAARFGVGFAPRGGDDLYTYLRQKGFQDEEIVTGGLVAQGNRGHYDRFRGRLLWPIRETNGDVIGFGARRVLDDDRIDAKYLNTPETPIYKKSQVLYGIDLARRDIARASQAVVVEGYTDVMACHLAGVPTAVATCGTAFGEEHGRVLRRLLHDHDEFRGEVIFTFDGDAAGQKAALRAFEGDQSFAGQTYVAVEPAGLDPCDLRLQQGDAAVRELVARRVPLYRFVLGNVVHRYDLDRADGRIDALRDAARLVTAIRDRSKVEAFARELAGMVGVDVDDARAEIRRAGNRRPDERRTSAAAPPAEPRPATPELPDLRDPRFALERETLKLVVQHPEAVGRMAKDVDGDDFLHPTYRAVWEVITACGGPASAPGGEVWVSKLRDTVSDQAVGSALSALAVEPLKREPTEAYAAAHVYRLQEVTALRTISGLKSRLQRTNPVEHPSEYNRMFGDLIAVEAHARALREKAIGGTT